MVLSAFLAESRQSGKPAEERRVLLKALRATAKALIGIADEEDALELATQSGTNPSNPG